MAATKPLQMKELLGKSLKDLVKLRNQLRKEIYEMKLKNYMRSLSQTHLIRVVRKNIAKVNTAVSLKSKELTTKNS